jgi:predicted Zn-dependent protease
MESRSAETLYAHAIERARVQDLVRAEQYLLAARSRGFPETRVMPILMRVLVASNRLRTALRYAQPYLRRHAEDVGLRYIVASIHVALGHPRAALDALEHVLTIAPDHGPSYYLSAVIWRDQLADEDAARAAFQHYVELHPDGAHAIEARSWIRTHVTTSSSHSASPASGGESESIRGRDAEPTPLPKPGEPEA